MGNISKALNQRTVFRNRFLLVFFGMLMFIGSGLAQDSLSHDLSLQNLFHKFNRNAEIVYIEQGLDSYYRNRLAERLESGTVSNSRSKEKLTLTADEKTMILQQLSQTETIPENYFTDGIRIDRDSLWTFLDQAAIKRRIAIEQAIAAQDTTALNKENYRLTWVFSFIVPIYLRDHSLCLIAYLGQCGRVCGYAESGFYKYVNGQWEPWIVVDQLDY